jgi:hypothetical protein
MPREVTNCGKICVRERKHSSDPTFFILPWMSLAAVCRSDRFALVPIDRKMLIFLTCASLTQTEGPCQLKTESTFPHDARSNDETKRKKGHRRLMEGSVNGALRPE